MGGKAQLGPATSGFASNPALPGVGFILLTSLLRGVNWPVTKFLITELPPLSTRAATCMIGATVMLGLASILSGIAIASRQRGTVKTATGK